MEEEEQAIVDAARKEMEEMPWPEGNTVTNVQNCKKLAFG